jgi:hypothetical protein
VRQHVVVLLSKPKGRALARKHCSDAGFDVDFLYELVDAELDQVGKKRKRGLWQIFDDILDRLEAEADAAQKNRS